VKKTLNRRALNLSSGLFNSLLTMDKKRLYALYREDILSTAQSVFAASVIRGATFEPSQAFDLAEAFVEELWLRVTSKAAD